MNLLKNRFWIKPNPLAYIICALGFGKYNGQPITWAFLILFKSSSLPTVLHRQFGNGVENPKIAAPVRKLFLCKSWIVTGLGQVMCNSEFKLCLWTQSQSLGAVKHNLE